VVRKGNRAKERLPEVEEEPRGGNLRRTFGKNKFLVHRSPPHRFREKKEIAQRSGQGMEGFSPKPRSKEGEPCRPPPGKRRSSSEKGALLYKDV